MPSTRPHRPTRSGPTRALHALGVAVLAVLAVTLTACGRGAAPEAPATTPADPAAAAAQDLRFAGVLAEHHHGTLQLIGLAAANAEDQRVIDLAGEAQLAHDARLVTLVDLLESRQQPVPHIEGHTDLGSSIPGVLTEAELTALLDAPAADFERGFLAALLARYGEAVPLAQQQLAAGADPTARQVAEQLIADAARHSAAVEQIVGG